MRREGESAQCATVNAYALPSQIGNSPILPLGPAATQGRRRRVCFSRPLACAARTRRLQFRSPAPCLLLIRLGLPLVRIPRRPTAALALHAAHHSSSPLSTPLARSTCTAHDTSFLDRTYYIHAPAVLAPDSSYPSSLFPTPRDRTTPSPTRTHLASAFQTTLTLTSAPASRARTTAP